MKHGSLFSGFGGFDLAAEWMGWKNVFHCEWKWFPKKILQYYSPNSITYHDITKTDFTIHRGTIDVLTGGFPCQPYSQAGKRLGKEDERHLWPEMLRAIREIQPSWVVGENVRGLTNWNGGVVFNEVQTDLETEGFKVLPFLLPAAGVGAPHRRDRIFFVAYSSTNSSKQKHKFCARGDMSKTCFGETQVNTNCVCNGCKQRNCINEVNTSEDRLDAFSNTCKGTCNGITSNTDITSGKTWTQRKILEQSNREAPNGYCNVECTNKWDNFPTQSPICGGNDGLPTKLDGVTFPNWRRLSIEGYGNAVVPQLALQIFKAIEEYEKLIL